MRWNGTKDNQIGSPQSRGIPTWFIVPAKYQEAILQSGSITNDKLALVRGFFPQRANSMLAESDLHNQAIYRIRYEEANYFLTEYIRYSSQPCDCYFGMIAAFDAFLFCFVSIEEMVSATQRQSLNKSSIFKLLKAFRDVSTHHSILAAPTQLKFVRPFSRHTADGPYGSSARLKLDIGRCRDMLTAVAFDPKAGKGTLAEAENYLRSIEKTGRVDVFLDDILREGMAAVAAVLGL